MVAIDANTLSLLIYPSKHVLTDFRNNSPIDRASEKAEYIVTLADIDGESIIVPAPALAEALTPVADRIDEYIKELQSMERLKICSFGFKAAIELAIRSHKAMSAGDKRDGVNEPWQKVKYDRQIVAIAKAEGASGIYSTDRGVHAHAEVFGLKGLHLGDVRLPMKQQNLSLSLTEVPTPVIIPEKV